MIKTILAGSAALLVAAAAIPGDRAPAPEESSADVEADTEGTWTAQEHARADRLQLNLHWETSNWGRSFARADLRGLTDREIGAATSTPVSFRIEREAGAFEMEGTFRGGKGSGHFRFVPNGSFAATLHSLGVEGADRVTDRELMQLALADASSARVREYAGLGLGTLDVGQLIELSIHDVTPEYVRSMRAAGVDGTGSVRQVVEMKIHRLTPAFVREMESLGFRDLSREQLLEMSIHGVDADWVRQLREAGYDGLSQRQLVEMKIHGVTPAYIREVREAGFRDLSAGALVEMRIHRVTPELVRELEALGYRGLSREQLVAMRIHGVTPAFIREMREAGFRDLSAETLVRMKIHGIDSEFVKTSRRPD